MGYAPIGVQREAIKMQEQKDRLLQIQEYLKNNPDVYEYHGYTRERICQEIQNINSFEFIP